MSTLQTTNLKHPDSSGTQVTFTSGGNTSVSGSTTFSSPIKASKLENASTTSGGVEVDTDGHVQVDGLQIPTAGALTGRNMIINGAMAVSQRYIINSGQTASAFRACDRFAMAIGSLGTWTIEQHPVSPDEFSNSFKVTCTTAESSPSNNAAAFILYVVEGKDAQRLGFGTASAKPITLSFWVQSNKTGNASFAILQNDNSNKLASFQYSISTANTWEYKTITIPADVAGLINNDTGEGLQLEWWLNSGSTYQGGSHQNTWGGFSNPNRNPSNLGVGATFDDYYQITGVQLEVGEKASRFEHEDFSQTLIKCQRYFKKIRLERSFYTASTNSFTQRFGIDLAPHMRIAPDILQQNGSLARLGKTYSFYNNIGDAGTLIYAQLDGSQSSVAEFTRMSDLLWLDAEF